MSSLRMVSDLEMNYPNIYVSRLMDGAGREETYYTGLIDGSLAPRPVCRIFPF